MAAAAAAAATSAFEKLPPQGVAISEEDRSWNPSLLLFSPDRVVVAAAAAAAAASATDTAACAAAEGVIGGVAVRTGAGVEFRVGEGWPSIGAEPIRACPPLAGSASVRERLLLRA